jgi:hypothetical protein
LGARFSAVIQKLAFAARKTRKSQTHFEEELAA